MRLVVLQRWTRLGRKQAIQSAVRLGRIQWGRSLFPDRARGRRESLQHIADSYLDVEIRVRSMLQAQRRHNNDNTATATATAAATAAATAIATTIATTTTTTINNNSNTTTTTTNNNNNIMLLLRSPIFRKTSWG